MHGRVSFGRSRGPYLESLGSQRPTLAPLGPKSDKKDTAVIYDI